MLTIKLWTTRGFNTILFIEKISLFFVVSGLVTEIGTQLLGPSQGSLDRLPFTYYSNLWYSGLIAICLQIVFFLRPLRTNGPSKSNITSNVSTNDSFWINGQLTSDKEELIPIIGNNFTVICDKIFTQDDLITATYSTPKWFIGRGWVGLVPASIAHYNESLNWRKSYASFRIDGLWDSIGR